MVLDQSINSDRLPEAHYGVADSPPEAMRPFSLFDLLDNDDELAVTPRDVVELLGFDPKDAK